MKIAVHYRPPEPNTYRAARVRSLFNVDSAAVAIEAELPLEERDWTLGVVVGPSGSGKSTIGGAIWVRVPCTARGAGPRTPPSWRPSPPRRPSMT